MHVLLFSRAALFPPGGRQTNKAKLEQNTQIGKAGSQKQKKVLISQAYES